MRKILALPLVLFLLSPICFAQIKQNDSKENSYVAPVAISVNFSLSDFTTPQRIRSSSLLHVLKNKQFAKIKEMYPGMGLSYYKGLLDHIDFAASLQASFARMIINNDIQATNNDLLLESEVTVNFKMVKDQATINPYLIIGIGASKFKGYYGAFMPFGAGIKINFLNEAALIITSQYLVPVTPETANYHFVHSIGIAGVLNAKKLQP